MRDARDHTGIDWKENRNINTETIITLPWRRRCTSAVQRASSLKRNRERVRKHDPIPRRFQRGTRPGGCLVQPLDPNHPHSRYLVHIGQVGSLATSPTAFSRGGERISYCAWNREGLSQIIAARRVLRCSEISCSSTP